MSSSDLGPVPMTRVAVVAPRSHARDVLVALADAGMMEVEELDGRGAGRDEATRMDDDVPDGVDPAVSPVAVDPDQLRDRGRWDLLAGEAAIARRRHDMVEHGPAGVLVGWAGTGDLDGLAQRLAETGASLVELPRPRLVVPPTRMPESTLRDRVRPLVDTYAIVPYEDVDPSLFAGITYVLMFGMMFGDVGHGLVLALLAVLLARSRTPRFASVRRLWLFPFAAGIVAAGFGLLYGEAFGPTGLVPTLWLSPLEEPVRLLVVAVGAGAALIAASLAIGSINRWREGGLPRALYSSTGLAGAALFLGAAIAAAGVGWQRGVLLAVGASLAGVGLVLSFIGFRVAAGSGGAATGQAVIELFDTVIRVFANVVSFGRLAAFGLTHAAIGFVVWDAARNLWGPGFGAVAAVVVFVVGNVLAFGLEGLVVGVQALRLEYYELFSRIFSGEGRLFAPWHVPTAQEES